MTRRRLRSEFTAIIERDEKWYIGYCPEIPGANGQEGSLEECKHSLAEAIAFVLQDRRADAQRGLPKDAIQEILSIS